MRWMHTNPVIQYSLTVLGSCGALIFFFCLFLLFPLYLFRCIDPDGPVYLLFLYTVVLVL